MFTVNIEMYGVPQSVTQQYKTRLDLEDGASLQDVIQALKQKMPAMEGSVIYQGQDRLIENFSFIVNGQSQPEDSDIRIQPNDRIVLVLMATGG